MIVVDALDAYLMSHPDRVARERYRRTAGWVTVAAAYAVALSGAAAQLRPELESRRGHTNPGGRRGRVRVHRPVAVEPVGEVVCPTIGWDR